MSVFDRISAIQMKMEALQARFGMGPLAPIDPLNPSAGRPASIAGANGLSFDQILASEQAKASSVSGNDGVSQGVAALDPHIQEAAATYGLDPALLKAVIQQESGGDSNCVSSAGAVGVMQLMPETAKSLGVTDPSDPRQSILGGARYLRGMMDRFGGDESLALAAYNAGPNAVTKYGGIPPYRETQQYVRNILAMRDRYAGNTP